MKIKLITHRGHSACSFRKTSRWMRYREKIAVCGEDHMKKEYPGQCAESVNVRAGDTYSNQCVISSYTPDCFAALHSV